ELRQRAPESATSSWWYLLFLVERLITTLLDDRSCVSARASAAGDHGPRSTAARTRRWGGWLGGLKGGSPGGPGTTHARHPPCPDGKVGGPLDESGCVGARRHPIRGVVMGLRIGDPTPVSCVDVQALHRIPAH